MLSFALFWRSAERSSLLHLSRESWVDPRSPQAPTLFRFSHKTVLWFPPERHVCFRIMHHVTAVTPPPTTPSGGVAVDVHYLIRRRGSFANAIRGLPRAPAGRLPRKGQRVRAGPAPSLPITSPLPARRPSRPPPPTPASFASIFHGDRRAKRARVGGGGGRGLSCASHVERARASLGRHHLFLSARVTEGLVLFFSADEAKRRETLACEGVWVLEQQGSRFWRVTWHRLIFPDLHQKPKVK